MHDLDALIAQELAKPSRPGAFAAPLERRYQQDVHLGRRRHLTLCLALGTLSYNSFLLWQLALQHGHFLWVAMQMLGTTVPGAALACLLLYKAPARWRESVAMLPSYTGLAGIYNVIIYGGQAQTMDETLFIFCWPLMLVYANSCMRSAFDVALRYNLFGLGLTTLAVSQAAVTPTTGGLMLTAAWSSAFFSLLGNYWANSEGRRSYLYRLREELRASSLSTANDRLQHLSETDPLTGVANRRQLQPHLDLLWQRHARGEGEGAVLLVDIDHFKAFNDHYGHLLGDECLRTVASTLRETLRPVDNLARFGGEEFVVLLNDVDAEAAVQIAERLLRSIRDLNIPHDGRADGPGRLTVSIGMAHTGDTHLDASAALLDEADRALYRAKREGRNRLVPSL